MVLQTAQFCQRLGGGEPAFGRMQQNLDDFAHLEKMGIAAEQELADKAQLALIAQLREGLKDRFQAAFVQRCQPGIGLVPGGFESKGARSEEHTSELQY